MSGADERKQRIIHARIPEDLERELKRKASRLGLSVSNLVRNVLTNTFGLVEDIITDSAAIARSTRLEPGTPLATPAGPRAQPAVLGWQQATLALNAVCSECNALLPKGTQAAIGITDPPGARAFLCSGCLEELTRESADDER